jgi:ATP-dependent Clp protease adaptor protein ClpS
MIGTSTIESTDVYIKRQPPYNLILLNDEYHSDLYVIAMCKKIFGHSEQKCQSIVKEVHNTGRSIIFTGNLELVELKQEQVHACGADLAVKNSKGSMSTEIEPAS